MKSICLLKQIHHLVTMASSVKNAVLWEINPTPPVYFFLVVRRGCPHCENAISLLRNKINVSFQQSERKDDGIRLRDAKETNTPRKLKSHSTFPFVFAQLQEGSEDGITRLFIGGNSDIQKLYTTHGQDLKAHLTGKLQTMHHKQKPNANTTNNSK